MLSPEKIRATTGGIASPPSLRTTFLPPLVKGEVLSPQKIGRLPEGLPHLPYPFRFSDTSVNNSSFHTQPSQNRTIPRKSPTPLPPLSKGGGLTARRKPLYCCFPLVPRPPFLFTKPFCRQDGGIATSPRPTPTLPNPHYPTRLSCCEFDSPIYHKNKIRPRFHGGELIKSLIYKY